MDHLESLALPLCHFFLINCSSSYNWTSLWPQHWCNNIITKWLNYSNGKLTVKSQRYQRFRLKTFRYWNSPTLVIWNVLHITFLRSILNSSLRQIWPVISFKYYVAQCCIFITVTSNQCCQICSFPTELVTGCYLICRLKHSTAT